METKQVRISVTGWDDSTVSIIDPTTGDRLSWVRYAEYHTALKRTRQILQEQAWKPIEAISQTPSGIYSILDKLC
jgi:hypothetical protein